MKITFWVFSIFFVFSQNAFSYYGIETISSKDMLQNDLVKILSKGGDFEGNGGDPIKLDYSIIYNFLKSETSLGGTLIPPRNIFDYEGEKEKIYFFDQKIYVPRSLFSKLPIRNSIVEQLFAKQGIILSRLDKEKTEKLKFLLASLKDGFSCGEERIPYYIFDELRNDLQKFVFGNNNIFFKFRAEISLGPIYDNKDNEVCAMAFGEGNVLVNYSCFMSLSNIEKKLLIAHETFRVLKINDDDYEMTYGFYNYLSTIKKLCLSLTSANI